MTADAGVGNREQRMDWRRRDRRLEQKASRANVRSWAGMMVSEVRRLVESRVCRVEPIRGRDR